MNTVKNLTRKQPRNLTGTKRQLSLAPSLMEDMRNFAMRSSDEIDLGLIERKGVIRMLFRTLPGLHYSLTLGWNLNWEMELN